ncbi:hypothetical protein [Kozakia baliensis]|uniref:hypothetical protein n=1 Tax=Kozakia baliensis TaxID=153496 RepID=UPI00116EB08B|nr:hypothetical protein [Kozakia baliensis]GBR30777.1 hypothetical protein AA0488_2095 [Kozakia baliensis NRIC 0488]GEL63025.1 hypothetical protein KBA01_03110 [Kozakia baliensis]
MTDAVHRRDGKTFLQLWHTGMMSHPNMHDRALDKAARLSEDMLAPQASASGPS